jgi:hypothetical protein
VEERRRSLGFRRRAASCLGHRGSVIRPFTRDQASVDGRSPGVLDSNQ